MITKTDKVYVVGGGLAGCEAAFQLAEMGLKVTVFEMRDIKMTPAHKTSQLAELVCSNSLGSMTDYSAPGQLKWEARKLNSLILKSAIENQIPAGMALGVDRDLFARSINSTLEEHPNIEVVREVINNIEDIPRPAIIATGPLTHEPLALSIKKHFDDEFLYFFDAIAPILDTESINMDKAWKADRWDKGSGDYINCPLNKDEYYQLINEIKNAKKVEAKDFEKNTPYFDGCMPIEEMVSRGDETLRFGPLSPKGLINPKTGQREYAVVQLRQENKNATAYNMVGFQTKMAYSEQKRVFSLIPGLENAEFLKLGSIHRNLYIHSPKKLNADLSSIKDPLLFFAGQITGVEGYFESTCIGLLVAKFLQAKVNGETFNPPPKHSAMGSLLNAITEAKEHFQPTNINFGLFPPIEKPVGKKLSKETRRDMIIERAKQSFDIWPESARPNESARP